MTIEVSRIDALRADARRNRDRIVDVAGELFAQRGLDVPMTAIARRAQVGVATLYRRFPTKEALVGAVFADQFTTCDGRLADALADPDPGRGLRTFLVDVCAMQAADRGFCAAFLAAVPDTVDVESEQARAVAGLTELVRRAREAGALRPDVTVADVVLVLMANRGIAAESAEAAVAASRRLVGLLLDALSAGAGSALPPPVALRALDVVGSAAALSGTARRR